MENQVFRYDLIIKESYLDTFGHVNNAAYLEILEEARWEFVTENGYGLRRIQETQQGPIILKVELRFLKEITLRQNISIFSQVVAYKKKIGTIFQWIEDQAGNRLLEANFVMGFFDMRNRKLITPPVDWLKAIGISNYESEPDTN